jgi:hypothetical protein
MVCRNENDKRMIRSHAFPNGVKRQRDHRSFLTANDGGAIAVIVQGHQRMRSDGATAFYDALAPRRFPNSPSANREARHIAEAHRKPVAPAAAACAARLSSRCPRSAGAAVGNSTGTVNGENALRRVKRITASRLRREG